MGTLRLGLMLVLICWLSSSVNNKLLSESSSLVFIYRNQNVIPEHLKLCFKNHKTKYRLHFDIWFSVFGSRFHCLFWRKGKYFVCSLIIICCSQSLWDITKKQLIKDFDTENEAWLKLQYWILFSCFICVQQSDSVSSFSV